MPKIVPFLHVFSLFFACFVLYFLDISDISLMRLLRLSRGRCAFRGRNLKERDKIYQNIFLDTVISFRKDFK